MIVKSYFYSILDLQKPIWFASYRQAQKYTWRTHIKGLLYAHQSTIVACRASLNQRSSG